MSAVDSLAREISDKAVEMAAERIRPTFERMALRVMKDPYYRVKSSREAQRIFGVTSTMVKKLITRYRVPVTVETTRGGKSAYNFLYKDFAAAMDRHQRDNGFYLEDQSEVLTAEEIDDQVM